jgi:hypothetical protein
MTTAAGRPASELCAYCNTPIIENDKFCGGCGQSVPSRSEVPLTAFIGDEPDPYATVASAVPPESSPELPGRAWPGTAEASGAPVWPGSDELVEATEASVGQATPNSTYIGMRLQYDKEPEPSFDPLENVRFLRQLFFRGFVYWLVYILGAIVAGIFFLVASVAIGRGLAFAGYSICGFLTVLVLLCMYWLLPLPVLLSEWKFSVDGKGAAASVAFEHIAWTLKQRETPLDSVQVRRLRLPGSGPRDYLELQHGLFLGYIACFPYGKDLYVGWTFYFRLSPLRWVLMFLARIWQTLSNRHTNLYVTLRYDSARAMREAMHSAAREGLDVAIGQLAPQGHGTVGGQLRVTEIAE